MLRRALRSIACCWAPSADGGFHEAETAKSRYTGPSVQYKAGPRSRARGTTDSLTDDVEASSSDVIPACWQPNSAAAAPAGRTSAAAAAAAPASRTSAASARSSISTAAALTPARTSQTGSTITVDAAEDGDPDQPSCSYPLPQRLLGLDPAARQACAVALAAHEHELSVRLNGSLSSAKELFWKYNLAEDGRLKPEELLVLLADLELNYEEDHVRQFTRLCFEAADVDGDGALSLWEWVHLYKVLSAVRAAFVRSDVYSTAQLSQYDFMRVMVDLSSSVGVAVPEDPNYLRAVAQRAFNNIDTEGRRYVTFEGVLAWFVTEALRGALNRHLEAWRASSSSSSGGGSSRSSAAGIHI